MSKFLSKINSDKKSGDETFHNNGTDLSFELINFWQWSASDLLDNTTRGILAEYLVAKSLGQTDSPRTEWDACDVITEDGTKVEVNSSSYIQSWDQQSYSKISFSIRSTKGWYSDSNTISEERKRQADFYVFCLLHHKDQKTIDPMNLDHWVFYIISTERLNEKVGNQKTISLSRLQKIGAEQINFEQIRELIIH